MVLPSKAIMKDTATSPRPPASPATPYGMQRRPGFAGGARLTAFRLVFGIVAFAALLMCFNASVLHIGRGNPLGYFDEGSPFPEGSLHSIITVRGNSAEAEAAGKEQQRTTPARRHPDLQRLLDSTDADIVAPNVIGVDGELIVNTNPADDNTPTSITEQQHAPTLQQQQHMHHARALQGRVKQYVFDGAKPNRVLEAKLDQDEPATATGTATKRALPQDAESTLEAFLRVAPVPRHQLDIITRLRSVCTITVVVNTPEGRSAPSLESRFPRVSRDHWDYARFNRTVVAQETSTTSASQVLRHGWLEYMTRPTDESIDALDEFAASDIDIDLVARNGTVKDKLMLFETLRVREYEAYLNGQLYPSFSRISSIRAASANPAQIRHCGRRHIYVLMTNESTASSTLGRVANIGALTATVDAYLGRLSSAARNASTLWFLDAAVTPRQPLLGFLRGLHAAVHGSSRPLGRLASCTIATGETVLSFGVEPVLDAHGDVVMEHSMSGFNLRDERVHAAKRVAAATPLCFAMTANAWQQGLQGLRSSVGTTKIAESLLFAGSLFKSAAFHGEQALIALDPIMRALPFTRPQARLFDSVRVALTKAIEDITAWEVFMNRARSPAMGCPVPVRSALKGKVLTVLSSTPGDPNTVTYGTEDTNDFATPTNLAAVARNTYDLLVATYGVDVVRDQEFDVLKQKNHHESLVREWVRIDMTVKRLNEFVAARERDETAMFAALLHINGHDVPQQQQQRGNGNNRRHLQGVGARGNAGPSRGELAKMLKRDIQRAADREAFRMAEQGLAVAKAATHKPPGSRAHDANPVIPTRPPVVVAVEELAKHKAAMKRGPPPPSGDNVTVNADDVKKQALLAKVIDSFRGQRTEHNAADAVLQYRRQELLRVILLEARRFLRVLRHRRHLARRAHARLVALCNAGDESLWDAGIRVGALADPKSHHHDREVPTVASTAQVEPVRLAHFLSNFVVARHISDNVVMAPHLPALTERATAHWLSTTVRVTWAGPCCGCCGFSNEMALILTPLARYVPTRTSMPVSCHCKGMPGSVESLLRLITVDRDDPALRRPYLLQNVTQGTSPASTVPVTTTARRSPAEASPTSEDGLVAAMLWKDVLDRPTPLATIQVARADLGSDATSVVETVPAVGAMSNDGCIKYLAPLVDDAVRVLNWTAAAESPVHPFVGDAQEEYVVDNVNVPGTQLPKNTEDIGLSPVATARHESMPPVEVWVYHVDPIQAVQLHWSEATADYKVSRSMFEFSRINPDWADILRTDEVYDEVWVPSTFVRDSFVASGVPAEKTFVVPEPIDVSYFDPTAANKIDLPVGIGRPAWRHASSLGSMPKDELSRFRQHFKFLSIFKWEPRKGWDLLFKAYFDTFTKADPVSLYVLTYHWWPSPPDKADPRDPNLLMVEIVQMASDAGKDLGNLPHFEVITEDVAETDVLALYATCDAFVLPSRGEGWGLPPIQAMAMAMPTITTRYSGMLDFTTNDTALLIDVERIELVEQQTKSYGHAPGATWAEPSLTHLSTLMREVAEMDPGARRALGARARRHIRTHFDSPVVATLIARRLMAIEAIVRARVNNGTYADLMKVRQVHDAAGRPLHAH